MTWFNKVDSSTPNGLPHRFTGIILGVTFPQGEVNVLLVLSKRWVTEGTPVTEQTVTDTLFSLV